MFPNMILLELFRADSLHLDDLIVAGPVVERVAAVGEVIQDV